MTSQTDQKRVAVTNSRNDWRRDQRQAALSSKVAVANRHRPDRFKIDGHALTRPRLRLVPANEAQAEIWPGKKRAGMKEVEDIVGTLITTFRYPRGEYAEHVGALIADGTGRERVSG